jgi:hypothetical protein
MCSIRNGLVQRKMKNQKRKTADGFSFPFFVFLFSFFVCAGGCQLINKEQPLAPVNNTPLVVDEAMQLRDWERSTNHYANGATIAGGTGYVWEVADWVNQGHRRFVDAPVAVLNFASMPVGLLVNSPFEKQVIRGEMVPPTYTGQPPLPGRPTAYTGPAQDATESPDEPSAPPPAPPTVETPPPPPTTETPPLAPTPPSAPPAPSPSDPITPPPAPDAPAPDASSAEPAPPATTVPPAPPAAPPPSAEPLNN